MTNIVREFTFTEDELKERELYFIELGMRGDFCGEKLRIYDDGTARLYGTWSLPEYLIEDSWDAVDFYFAEIILKTDVDFNEIISPDQILNSDYEYGDMIVLEENEGE
ncbi:MAG TPA: hypothetical protein PKI14_15735 [Fervidobacterium sp.]|nr:hypothetical protein [Fervidobacterium sp.]